MIILPKAGLILCFSHFTHTHVWTGNLTLLGQRMCVNLTIPAHSPCPCGFPLSPRWDRTPGTALRCHCRWQTWALLTFCPDGRAPCEPVPGHSRPSMPVAQRSLPGWRCRCQRAAASQPVYFWKSLNFTVKDMPEGVRKSTGELGCLLFNPLVWQY